MLILDVCCGSEKIYQGWQKRLNGEFVTMDKRKGDFSYDKTMCGSNWLKNEVIVKPMVLADMRYLPFRDGVFSAIVCDPPHLKCGENSNLAAYYGSWDVYEAIRVMRLADPEFARVLSPNGFVFLKTMLDRKNVYLEMLKGFTFFLPIQLKRPRGSMKNPKAEVDGALWMIGSRRQEVS